MEGPELDQNVILKPLDVFVHKAGFNIKPDSLVFHDGKVKYGNNLGGGYNNFNPPKAPYLEDYPTEDQAWSLISHNIKQETVSFPALERVFTEKRTKLFGFVIFDGKVIAVSAADRELFLIHTSELSVLQKKYAISVSPRPSLVLLTGLSEKEIIVYDVLKR